MNRRTVLGQLALAAIVIVLVNVAAPSGSSQDPVLSASLTPGSLVCDSWIHGPSGWYFEVSHTQTAPSGRPILPTCGNSANSSAVWASSTIQTNAFTNPGVWKCHVNAHGTTSGGGSWGDNVTAEFNFQNPTCDCAAPAANFALTFQGGSIGFYLDGISGSEESWIRSWYGETRNWWNDQMSYAGSSKRINETGSWPIRLGSLPGNFYGEFDPVTKVMTIDPRIFALDPYHAQSLVGHELGHALGITGHSTCGNFLMSAEVNSAQPIRDAEKCWVYTEYTNFNPTCSRS